jgi:hypothetical protein
MSHDIHAPGTEAQVLRDNCAECSHRSRQPDMAISNLDPRSFAAAWTRAAEWERGRARDVSSAEVPVLRVLWAVQCQMERLGFPIGEVPQALAGALLAAGGAS